MWGGGEEDKITLWIRLKFGFPISLRESKTLYKLRKVFGNHINLFLMLV